MTDKKAEKQRNDKESTRTKSEAEYDRLSLTERMGKTKGA